MTTSTTSTSVTVHREVTLKYWTFFLDKFRQSLLLELFRKKEKTQQKKMFNIQTKSLNGELIKRSSGFVSFVDLGISLRHSYHHHPSTGIRDTVWKTTKNYVVLVLFWVFSDMNISVLIKKIPISLWNWKKIEEFLKNINERKVRKRNRQSELEFLWPNFVSWLQWLIQLLGQSIRDMICLSTIVETSLHNFVHGIGKTWEIYL